MDIAEDSGIRKVIRPQRKVMQIYRMEIRRRKRQVDVGKVRKHKEGNVDIGNGT